MDMKLEVVVSPVGDVDRAKRFYEQLGWRLDADFASGSEFRVVQFTPPGSSASIHFGKGLTTAAPDLERRGVAVSEIFHKTPGGKPGRGLDPDRRSYASFGWFAARDPAAPAGTLRR
jgi:catechol 2,3-dioxygenase-like lactoylglutathione lyase family enzyme